MTRLKVGLAVVAVIVLTGGGFLWLRGSSLVAVQDVQITGVTASDGDKVRAALESVAKDMTTLNVREEVLREASASYTSVDDVKVQSDFPHTLRIQVIERRPVAAVSRPGERRVPVTSNGTLLRGVTAERDLPSVKLKRDPAGARITDRRILNALTVAGAAPDPLRGRTDEVKVDKRGVIVDLQEGPELIFGGGDEADKKWAAAARVLAEISAQGATYLDLRIPGRVAAGGLAPIATPTPDPNAQPEAENSPTLNP
ncbi:FtsQ-type POTRA domain-containing protein [Solirubrobacter sp. CPCC 204708]|uniref:FtsQ-type POTRA domain-containing protein n=1 Tax=Solirubrobacter deserti TaxID=2282478 RepID=A0ABT4RR17_9ACTN|nr:FtsQ-type POTRA domain-containing protein [Solirubrobacter deserti]MBE2314701.1 FtsQ-type POTRA domain-containing protein [Solirubrobacter deserti]MDA0141018.1 FtsQ-type POTRA domain-containing protein [Solirubrobacter deserti]